MMEFKDVLLLTPKVEANGVFKLTFEVIGAEGIGFWFPFSNESLTEPKIQFSSEKDG